MTAVTENIKNLHGIMKILEIIFDFVIIDFHVSVVFFYSGLSQYLKHWYLKLAAWIKLNAITV